MKRTYFFILLFSMQITFGFSQEITGKLRYIGNDKPATGIIYLDGVPDISATESIQKDGAFIILNLENISTIEITTIWGSIIFKKFDSEINYNLGNIYFIENPHNELHHFVYKTKIGYYLSWLTEGLRSKRLTRKAIRKNYNILIDKYKSEGKKSNFLKKYTGNKQVLNLNSLNNKK